MINMLKHLKIAMSFLLAISPINSTLKKSGMELYPTKASIEE